MIEARDILAVIPARSGSKGVPKKNVRSLCGVPMIGYTVQAALESRHCFDRIVVSTEDEDFAELSRKLGAEVPFLRPPELAGDRVPMVPVLQHVVRKLERSRQRSYEWVCLLQPTEPFRTREDIEACIALADEGGCDSVISVVQVFSVHPLLMKKIEDNRLVPFSIPEQEGCRRQDLSPPSYMRNGAVYLARRDVLMNEDSLWGEIIRPYVMPEERSIGVDSELDFRLAEVLMSERLGDQESITIGSCTFEIDRTYVRKQRGASA